MLQQLNWKQKSEFPFVEEIRILHPVAEIKRDKEINKDCSISLSEALQYKIDHKTKPTGALGVLEKLAKQIGELFQTLKPKIILPHIVVFAADHGIAQHGVSAYPQDVTRQMVSNFLEGGAAINVFCKQNNINLSIVDAGVNYDFPPNAKLVSAKIDKGTQSFIAGPAMSKIQMELCFTKGSEIVKTIAKSGSNCVGFGEMGIGNTSTASVLMSVLCGFPIEDCVGRGTGVNDEKLIEKQMALKKALDNYSGLLDLDSHLAYFGGFEILQMAAGMLEAYENRMLILVDGFICSVAFLVASKKNPLIIKNAVFSHQSAEQAHGKLLDYLEASAILKLDLRLGEGTGCAIVFPIIESAVAFLNEMASFESAGVSSK
jgi:nicotinate-nucleotide--dimethylbenzimidazole phosphoribosyltransferase